MHHVLHCSAQGHFHSTPMAQLQGRDCLCKRGPEHVATFMIPFLKSKLRLNIPDSRSLTSGPLTEHETARAMSHVGGLRQRNHAAADQF